MNVPTMEYKQKLAEADKGYSKTDKVIGIICQIISRYESRNGQSSLHDL